MIIFQKSSRRIVISLISVFILFGLSLIGVKAESEQITRSAEFKSESTEPEYKGFQSEIEDNGKKYSLDKVTYEKIDEKQETVLEDKTTTVTKSGLSSKSYSVGSTETITVDGKSYQGTVTDVVYTDQTKINRTGEVSGSQDYGLRVDKPNPPDTKSLQYYDSDTGQTLNIDAPLISLDKTDTKWQDYTYIDIVVSNYTDTQFMFNDKIITHNGTTVLDSSHYSELLNMAGLTGDKYKVSSVKWTSDSYKESGTRYRNARANIQANASSYTARYYKKFSLPDLPSYRADITFKYSQENVLKTLYTFRATGEYRLSAEETTIANTTQITQPTTVPQPAAVEVPVTIKTVTTISLILVISLAFVLLGFFLLTKIKSKDTELSRVLSKKRRRRK